MKVLVVLALCGVVLSGCLEAGALPPEEPVEEAVEDGPGPFLEVRVTKVAPINFGEACLARRVSLLDSRGRVYTAPTGACDVFTVDLTDGETSETVETIFSGALSGVEIRVRPVLTL